MSLAPGFVLHARLAADCIGLGRFPLSRVLLMNERRYPWLILVPERPGIREIHDMTDDDQVQLIRESSLLSRRLQQGFAADKLNVAAIGNRVPQLHVHHVARFRDDAAWPHPVWGRFEPEPYPVSELDRTIERLSLATLAGFEPGCGA